MTTSCRGVENRKSVLPKHFFFVFHMKRVVWMFLAVCCILCPKAGAVLLTLEGTGTTSFVTLNNGVLLDSSIDIQKNQSTYSSELLLIPTDTVAVRTNKFSDLTGVTMIGGINYFSFIWDSQEAAAANKFPVTITNLVMKDPFSGYVYWQMQPSYTLGVNYQGRTNTYTPSNQGTDLAFFVPMSLFTTYNPNLKGSNQFVITAGELNNDGGSEEIAVIAPSYLYAYLGPERALSAFDIGETNVIADLQSNPPDPPPPPPPPPPASAVPEPATISFMLVLGGIIWRWRRSRFFASQ